MRQEFEDFFQTLYRALKQTLLHPQAAPRQTVIVGLVLILVVAILVLIALSLYSRMRPQKRILQRRKMRRLNARDVLVIWGVVAGVFLIFILAGYTYVERSSFCASCHVVQKESESWKRSSHRNLGCLACHRPPGLSGYATQKIDYLRWAWKFAFSSYHTPLRASVSNSTCKKCHSDVVKRVLTRRDVRVRHKDFLEEGARCVICHSTVGHEVTIARYPSMDECITCHNTKTARAECDTCHIGSPRGREASREVLRIGVAPVKQCRGCHKASTWERCIRCHGLELPHPNGWTEGHARQAFLGKELCLRCHSFPSKDQKPGGHGGGGGGFCNSCHRFPSPHGTSASWARQHGPIALKTVSPGATFCDRCHEGQKGAAAGIPADIAECDMCHSGKFCDRCHPQGKYSIRKL